MTCNTSAVAVCCSNASRVSVISRAFSIAMTACAAKFCSSAICFVGKRPDLLAVGDDDAEQAVVLAQRHAQQRPGAAESTLSAAHRAVAGRLADRSLSAMWMKAFARPIRRASGVAAGRPNGCAATPSSGSGMPMQSRPRGICSPS